MNMKFVNFNKSHCSYCGSLNLPPLSACCSENYDLNQSDWCDGWHTGILVVWAEKAVGDTNGNLDKAAVTNYTNCQPSE